MDKFDDKLVLKDFLYSKFGVEDIDDFKEILEDAEEGFQADNRSEFSKKLESSDLEIDQKIIDKLPEYDQNISTYEEKLNRNREENIQLKYFQWLSLLFTEYYLDQYFNNKDQLWSEFSSFVEKKRGELETNQLHAADPQNLTKIAYWMATGSGKTFILHANLWQYQKYGNGDLENILLITPNEGLTQQHIEEFEDSGINAKKFRPENSSDSDVDISVLDVYKLTEESGDKTYSVDIFEGDNLVFVDEGHKGAKGDTWIKNREKVIGEEGFSFEYSATFGQALNSIDNEMLQNRYVQSIIFDYSFREFHEDGFGKNYDILNLEDEDSTLRNKYLVANLLSFYEQKKYFRENREVAEEFNFEDPLWIFVGQTVNATGRDVSKKQKASDVEKVVKFLNRILEDKSQVIQEIEEILDGSEFLDPDGKRLFDERFDYLRNSQLSPEEMYGELLDLIFNSQTESNLKVIDLKGTEEREIGLKVGSNENYFGLVSIGDAKKFVDRIEENSEITTEEQEFKRSLFDNINSDDSDVNLLIGAKKFVEGWDSYRVSNMGLMNVGKSEGSEIIQIFGRGIRLKGYGNSLKRSSQADVSPDKVPRNIEILERLNVFGIEADYIKKFEDKLEKEDIPSNYIEKTVETDVDSDLVDNDLKVPRITDDKEYSSETTIKIKPEEEHSPKVDLYSKIRAMRSEGSSGLEIDKNRIKTSSELFKKELIDWENIFVDIVQYKERKGYSNLIINKNSLKEIIEEDIFLLQSPNHRFKGESLIQQKENTEEIVRIILRAYIENFYKKKKGDWEDRRRDYEILEENDSELNFKLKFQIPDEDDLVDKINDIIENPEALEKQYVLDFDRSLYQPLYIKDNIEDEFNDVKAPAQALNSGEKKLVDQLKDICQKGLLNKQRVFLLRNPRNGGVGFAEGGYPDFLLWIKEGDNQNLIFLDPHGMYHEPDTLEDVEKIKLHQRVKEIEERLDGGIEMSSYVISTTKVEALDIDEDEERMRELNFFHRDQDTLEKILKKENLI